MSIASTTFAQTGSKGQTIAAFKVKNLKNVSPNNNDAVYHNTFSGAVGTARNQTAVIGGFILDEIDWMNKINLTSKPKSGSTTKASINLWKGGKRTKKYLHIQVYNRGTKNNTFELNYYIS